MERNQKNEEGEKKHKQKTKQFVNIFRLGSIQTSLFFALLWSWCLEGKFEFFIRIFLFSVPVGGGSTSSGPETFLFQERFKLTQKLNH